MRLLLDENFNNNVLRGLLKAKPDLDYLRAQDIPEISGKDDPTLLEWAAEQNRVLLTHDVRTITRYAYDRVREGKPMPGIIEVKRIPSLSRLIEDILIVIETSTPGEIEGKVFYLPL